MDNSTTTWIVVAVLLILIGAAIFMLLRRPGGNDEAVERRDDSALDGRADNRAVADRDGDGVPAATSADHRDEVYDQNAADRRGDVRDGEVRDGEVRDGVVTGDGVTDQDQDSWRQAAAIGATGAAGAGAMGAAGSAGAHTTDDGDAPVAEAAATEAAFEDQASADATYADSDAADQRRSAETYGEHQGTYDHSSDEAYVADGNQPYSEGAYAEGASTEETYSEEDQGRWREAASIGAVGAGATGAAAATSDRRDGSGEGRDDAYAAEHRDEDYAADQQGVHPLSTEEVDAGASEDPLAVADQTPAEVDESHHDEGRQQDQGYHDDGRHHDQGYQDGDTYAGADAGADDLGHRDDDLGQHDGDLGQHDDGAGWGTAAAAGAAGAAGATVADERHDHPEARGDEGGTDLDAGRQEEYPVGDSTYRADDGHALEVDRDGRDLDGSADRERLGEPASEGYTAAPASDGYTAAPASPEAYQDESRTTTGDYSTREHDAEGASTAGYAPVAEPVTDGTRDDRLVDDRAHDDGLRRDEHRDEGLRHDERRDEGLRHDEHRDEGLRHDEHRDDAFTDTTDTTTDEGLAQDTAAVGAGEAVFAESIYGPGSAEPLEDGSGPAGWEFKGNAGSMLFHTPDSPSYDAVRTEVWFESEEAARAAGFAHWDRRRR